MTLFSPCIRSVGPSPAKLLVLGEAPGETEEQMGIPFVGYSGQLLDDMLKFAGIARSECYLTNVFFSRPPNNKLEHFCVPRTDPSAATEMPALQQGRYLKSEFRPELQRLRNELRSVRPNLILALGNTAAWATLKQAGISKIRGTIVNSEFGKVLPTYHPAAIFRQWDLRPIVQADIMKAAMEKEFPEVKRPERTIIYDPTLEDISRFSQVALQAKTIACDIETRLGQITCIGFAISKTTALVVPFVDDRKSGRNFWKTQSEEIAAWKLVQELLELPVPKIFQNGLYDLQYLRRMKLRVVNCLHDTMILHHAMHPELLKGLGFMGSVYTNEPAWKLMRKRSEDNLKRDDE